MDPDISPYGVTQHADAEMVTANALVGELMGSMPFNATPASGPAFLSTAPYIPPGRLRESRTHMCKAKDDTCRAYRVKGSDYCFAHQPDDA